MSNLFRYGQMISHSGLSLPWKIDCDALADEDIEALANIVGNRIKFRDVIGVPGGGLRFCAALQPYCNEESERTLIVDDILTTGRSMEEWRASVPGPSVGVVIFARGPVPFWVHPIFVVENWTQSDMLGQAHPWNEP